MVRCPLCKSDTTVPTSDNSRFHSCKNCRTVFRNPDNYPSAKEEKERYLEHNNDVEDSRYQDFVMPIVREVNADYKPHQSKGLDFGAGTGPVITKLLRDQGYNIALYDPFFHPDRAVLRGQYDFIVCCEVIEHFHRPLEEFQLLSRLLSPNGRLYCMSLLFDESVSLETWYYAKDSTHVTFYSEANLNWIRKKVGFTKLEIDGRLIVFTK